jgi:hypothetical protein
MAKSIITLSNGLRVGNFSSPHPFTFEDGNVLPPASDEDVAAGTLEAKETEFVNERFNWTDIDLAFKITPSCADLLAEWMEIFRRREVDIVLIPLPVKSAGLTSGLFTVPSGGVMKIADEATGRLFTDAPFRVIRVRKDKRKERWIHIDRFCV